MSQLSPNLRSIVFYGIFGFLLLLYVAIFVGSSFAPAGVFGAWLTTFVSLVPIALERLPSELAPAVLGGILAWTAPLRSSNLRTMVVMVLSALVWLTYLHAQVIFQSDDAAQAMASGDYTGNVVAAQATLASFASSIRNFAAVVFAATIGLKLNDAVPPAPPAEAVPVGDAAPAVDAALAVDVPPGVPTAGEPVPQEPDDVPDPKPGQAKG